MTWQLTQRPNVRRAWRVLRFSHDRQPIDAPTAAEVGEDVSGHGICAARVRTASARLYSADEAARLAGKSARAIRRWIREGRVRAVRYGSA